MDPIQTLQGAVRRWKAIAAIGWGLLAFAILAGAALVVTHSARVREQQRAAEQARQEALMQMERVRQAEEGARK